MPWQLGYLVPIINRPYSHRGNRVLKHPLRHEFFLWWHVVEGKRNSFWLLQSLYAVLGRRGKKKSNQNDRGLDARNKYRRGFWQKTVCAPSS